MTGSAELFLEAGLTVRRMILRDLRHYKRTGRCRYYLHSSGFWDGEQQAKLALTTLAAAGLVPQSMTRIADPVPLFDGLELIQGIEPLLERIQCDDALLEVRLLGLMLDVRCVRVYPNCLKMSLLITENERQEIGEGKYELHPTRSCIATFAMRVHPSMCFWPSFDLDSIERMRLSRESRPRGQTSIKVKLKLGSSQRGRLYCREMELLSLEEVSCALP